MQEEIQGKLQKNMQENVAGLYSAFCAKDSRFDGRFFVGISSTGIYCRPVCRAKIAKKENCTFFSTAAEAEGAGYRPCLMCRPELAPGLSVTDASATLAKRGARMIEEGCGSGDSLDDIAGRLGCSGRHLRRVFEEELHVSPVEYLQTCRLLLAKSLLTDTNLQVIDIAMASGFGSLRRFNDAFQKKYHLAPTALRRTTPEAACKSGEINLTLGYRPPYLWRELLLFLKERTIPGVETVQDDCYYRTVRVLRGKEAPVTGWIGVSNRENRNALNVTLSESLLPVLPQVLAKVRTMFDINCQPEIVFAALSSMNEIETGLCVKGTRLPGCFDAFEMAVRAILGQQITVKAARVLAGRVALHLGTPLKTFEKIPVAGLTHLFPTPEELLGLDGKIEEHLGPLGVIATRARAIEDLATAISSHEISFDQCQSPEQEMEKLMKIKGIGGWTANYIAMRTMAWPDAFLETDSGIRHALHGRSAKELLDMAHQWRPWRSYGVINLWNSLSREGEKKDEGQKEEK